VVIKLCSLRMETEHISHVTKSIEVASTEGFVYYCCRHLQENLRALCAVLFSSEYKMDTVSSGPQERKTESARVYDVCVLQPRQTHMITVVPMFSIYITTERTAECLLSVEHLNRFIINEYSPRQHPTSNKFLQDMTVLPTQLHLSLRVAQSIKYVYIVSHANQHRHGLLGLSSISRPDGESFDISLCWYHGGVKLCVLSVRQLGGVVPRTPEEPHPQVAWRLLCLDLGLRKLTEKTHPNLYLSFFLALLNRYKWTVLTRIAKHHFTTSIQHLLFFYKM
ncbi:hypothetical protein L9F63_009207, partial [Diploptera punctata]